MVPDTMVVPQQQMQSVPLKETVMAGLITNQVLLTLPNGSRDKTRMR